MKNRWRQRGFALMAALALAIPAAGVTVDPTDAAELLGTEIYIEDVEPVVGSDDVVLPVEPEESVEPEDPSMYDPLKNPDFADPDYVAPTQSAAPETTPDAADATEGPLGSSAADTPEGQSNAENTQAPEGEAVPESTGATDPSVADASEGRPGAADAETAGDAPGTEAVGEPGTETTDAPENAGESETETVPEAAAPEITEQPEANAAPEASAAPEATVAPVAIANSEAEDAVKATAAPESTDMPELSESPEATPTPEAADAGALAQAAEAAPALAFNAGKIYLGKGERRTLDKYLVGAEGLELSYASNKKNIVSVDASGTLRARKKGAAKITVTASNGMTASCTVKVVKAPSKIKLSAKKLIFGVTEGRTLTAKLPKGTASAITWVSSNPAVVTVDDGGSLMGVGTGTAKITARTFNGKKASCAVTILGGTTPTSLSFPSATISLGLRERRQLQPQLGPGEAAIFTFSSSKKKVVSVTAGGVMVARKKGTAKLTVKTHNGLKYKLTVKVVNAPSGVTVSKNNFTMTAGEAATVTAKVNSGSASAITWSSSDPSIAAIDDGGNIVAIAPGTVTLTATAFNGKSASCSLTVVPPPTPEEIAKNTPPALTNAQMAANLRAATSLGSKREALGNVAELLMNNGFSPAFAAGVVANCYSEGSYGKLESSKYVANYQKRPKYFCYLDGGIYYTLQNGEYVPAIEFVAPEEIATYAGSAPKVMKRYGEEKYYWNNWSGKYVYDCDLNALQAFIDLLTNAQHQDGSTDTDEWTDGKGWHGKFGMGITQWTGGRTRKLMARYRKYAGEGSATITKEQVIAAENEMILYDLQGDYKKVYTEWLKANENAQYCPEAAYSAGSLVCLKYEIPANKETSAVKRGNNASKFYNIMVGAS